MFRQSFREWLIERLIETKFARDAIPDAQIDAAAKQLGVDPDVLLDARARTRERRHEHGLRPRMKKLVPADVQARHSRLYQFHLYMPGELFRLWKDECAYRGIEGSTLLRALIHSYLLSSYEPTSPVTGWYWKGSRYRMGDAQIRRDFLERAVIPQGAKRALRRRAARFGGTSVGIVRALVLEAMAGKHRKVPVIDAGMMFDDEDRYYQGPSRRS
jgi:hypothetical protein